MEKILTKSHEISLDLKVSSFLTGLTQKITRLLGEILRDLGFVTGQTARCYLLINKDNNSA